MTTRVEYRDSQILEAKDLTDEQVYRIAMRHRHNIAHHGWGIVTGLELCIDTENTLSGVVVMPGFAVDGYGRELVLSDPVKIDMQAKDGQSVIKRLRNPDAIDFWLVYREQPASPPDGEANCSVSEFSRTEELAVIRCTAANDIDPQQPPFVPPEDYDFPPQGEVPDDPDQMWPVFLGRVCRIRENDPTVDNPPVVDQVVAKRPLRPYATLKAGCVTGISQHVRMKLIDEDRHRAQWLVQTKSQKTADEDQAEPVQDPLWRDRILVTNTDHVSLTGRVDNRGQVRIEPEVDDFGEGTRLRRLRGEQNDLNGLVLAKSEQDPAIARPWQLYRTYVAGDEEAGTSASDEMRIELPFSEDEDPDRSSLRVGGCPLDENRRSQVQESTFQAICSVSAKDAVFVEDLEVTGQLVTGPIEPDPSDPRYRRAWFDRWVDGVTAAIRAVRANLLTVDVQLDKATTPNTPWNIKIRNPGYLPVTITAVFGTYSVGDVTIVDDQPPEAHDFSSLPPPKPVLEPGEETTVVTKAAKVWPLRPPPLGSDFPTTLFITVIGRTTEGNAVLGRDRAVLNSKPA